MTAAFRWQDADQTRLLFTVTGLWTWGDLHRQLKRAALWLDTHERPVTAVIDLRGGWRLPAGVVGHVRSLPNSFQHPRASGTLIVLGVPNDAQRSLGAVGDQITVGGMIIRFSE